MAGLKHNQLTGGLKYGALVALLVFGLAACGPSQMEPRLEIVDAKLLSQSGQTPFEAKVMPVQPRGEIWNLSLVAETDGILVYFGIVLSGRLAVALRDPRSRVEFVEDNAFYETNFTAQQRLESEPGFVFLDLNQPSSTLEFELPTALRGLFIQEIDGYLSRNDINRINAMKDDIHRFYFEFSVDGAPFVVDVAFRLRAVRP